MKNRTALLYTSIILPVAMSAQPVSSQSYGNYAAVNGLKMYYEIHGSGKPLVLIHGGGSTIQTTFGTIIPYFNTRMLIAVELQAHGHTPDRGTPSSFEQDADDVAALLQHLQIEKADVFGFSNGGNTAMQLAIRHPQVVNKLVVGSAFYKRNGLYPQLWEFMKQAKLENMPQGLKDAYLDITNSPEGLQIMHDRDAVRMQTFTDWDDDDISNIKAPTLIIIGDNDTVKPEHAVEMYRLLPSAKLLILPGQHGEYIGELIFKKPGSNIHVVTAGLINDFLNTPGNTGK